MERETPGFNPSENREDAINRVVIDAEERLTNPYIYGLSQFNNKERGKLRRIATKVLEEFATNPASSQSWDGFDPATETAGRFIFDSYSIYPDDYFRDFDPGDIDVDFPQRYAERRQKLIDALRKKQDESYGE